MSKKAILLTILLLNLSSITSADIYKWTDEQGTVHITDDLTNAPPKIKKNNIQTVKQKANKIPFKDGYIKIQEEKPNSFGFSIHYNDPTKGHGKISGCFEEQKGSGPRSKNMCREMYEQFIKTLKQ